MNRRNKQIICTEFSDGKTHDFKLFQRSKFKINRKATLEVDLGYRGVEKIHPLVRIPKKRSKKHPLTEKDKKYNLKVSRSRVMVEHVIRRLKRFKILAEKYRNRRKRYSLRMNLICGLYNFDLQWLRKKSNIFFYPLTIKGLKTFLLQLVLFWWSYF